MAKSLRSVRNGLTALAVAVAMLTVPGLVGGGAALAEPAAAPGTFLAGDPIGRYIVVLGARMEPGGDPPAILEQRLDRAAALSRANPFNRIIVTGGNTWKLPVSEATFMHLELVERGVTPWLIIDEHTAMSTVENAIRVVAMLKNLRATGAVVVTNGFHMPRAMHAFRTQAHDQQVALSFEPAYA